MIQIPERINKLLISNAKSNFLVCDVFDKYYDLLKYNKAEFFPEYTDHGVSHINTALNVADAIITEDSFSKLSVDDVAALVCATVFHDLGMHIGYESFIAMIDKNNTLYDEEIGDKPWSELWDDYTVESHHWTSKKIKKIFGTNYTFKGLNADRSLLTENDRKFIGEFLRRHHHRLAYEICVFGFIDINSNRIRCSDVLDNETAKIIGLISRSHGIGLWNAIDVIENIFGKNQVRETKKIHAPYIMIVLRISDYLDIDKNRASSKVLKYRKLLSEISEVEWYKHHAVEYIKMDYQDDPESIYIYVNPVDSIEVYLAIENLFNSIQDELDECWAVLGKVYGNFENLKLTFRRLHSNFIDKPIYNKNIKFVPEKVQFDSNPDLLKLLIAPLYGDNPAFGVREILQNSIDACLERSIIDSECLEKLCIEIEISEEDSTMTITDNGIGMDSTIIQRYFLVAGASYRNDETWKSQFEEDAKSVIPRSGRFGIGVFASFLLGSEIQVETKRLNNPYKYSFCASLNSEKIQINMDIDGKKDVGTTIKIKLYEEVLNELKKQCNNSNSKYREHWHKWYCSSRPKLTFKLPKSWKNHNAKLEIEVPLYNDDIDKKVWNELKQDDYNKILWTNDKKEALICNGIMFQGRFMYYKLDNYRFGYLNSPTISVIDHDAKLNLTLNRNGLLNDKLPFENELVVDIYKKIIQDFCKSYSVGNLVKYNGCLMIKKFDFMHNAFSRNGHYYFNPPLQNTKLIFSKNGYNLLTDYVITGLGIKSVTKYWTSDSEINLPLNMIEDDFLVFSNETNTSIDSYKMILDYRENLNLGYDYKIIGIRATIPKEKYYYLFDPKRNRLRKGLVDDHKIESETDMWIVFSYGITDNFIDSEKYEIENYTLKVVYNIERVNENTIESKYNESISFDSMLSNYRSSKLLFEYISS